MREDVTSVTSSPIGRWHLTQPHLLFNFDCVLVKGSDFELKADKSSSNHYGDFIMGTMASQITSLAIAYSTVHSDADQRKHRSSASLAFVRGIHRGPVNSPHKWPVTWKMFPFDDVIMWDHDSNLGISGSKSPADWTSAQKPAKLSKIKLKTWTRLPIPDGKPFH